MLDHSGIYAPASKGQEVLDWYEKTLKPLGYTKLRDEMNGPVRVVGFSDTGKHSDWWVIVIPEHTTVPFHHAFASKDRASVDAFHAEGTKSGGECNGEPGLRPHYHATYYAAFVKDPLGNNIEAVCHAGME